MARGPSSSPVGAPAASAPSIRPARCRRAGQPPCSGSEPPDSVPERSAGRSKESAEKQGALAGVVDQQEAGDAVVGEVGQRLDAQAVRDTGEHCVAEHVPRIQQDAPIPTISVAPGAPLPHACADEDRAGVLERRVVEGVRFEIRPEVTLPADDQ